MDRLYLAKQANRALQIFAQNLELDDSQAMEIADMYPEWEFPKVYAAGTIVKHGLNADGETQLYRVQQEHTSQSDWTPDTAAALYGKIGFADNGIPVWTQPLGAHDAYQIGDIVMHNGATWECTAANNVYEPGVYGWTAV